MRKIDCQPMRVINYYRRAAEDYDKEYDQPYWKELYDKITWRYIEPYLPMEGLVLDAGGGTGKWSIPIAQKGLKVILYDISPEMLSVAEKKIKERNLLSLIHIEKGDICDIKFPDNYFDFVLAEGDPISYCSTPWKAVKELARVLKPERYICAGVDSLYSFVRRFANITHDLEAANKILQNGRFYADTGFNCWAFTPKSLKELFKSSNLQVIKVVGKPVVYTREAEQLLQDPDKAKELLKLELALCEEESIVGYGGHLHIVAKKLGS